MPISKASGQAVAPAAKGDLVVGSATNDAAVLSVGSANQVLTVDSSTTTGLKWATASAGGITLIQETTASAISSLSFSSIAGTYKDLILVWHGIYTSDNSRFILRFNSNSGTVYNGSYLTNGGSNFSTNQSDDAGMGDGNLNIAWNYTGGTTRYWEQWQGVCYIYNYASTDRFKKYNMTVGGMNGASARGGILNATFSSTSAITSLDISRASGVGTFTNATSTSIRLYGVS